jgi:signal transduction histidine kinase
VRRSGPRSAAWTLSLRPTAAFAAVTMVAFVLMYLIAAHSIRQHNDAWLRGEAEVLRQVSVAAAPGAPHDGVVQAIAISAAREVTGASSNRAEREAMIFFLEMDTTGHELIWLGPEPRQPFLDALRAARLPAGKPRTVTIPGQPSPFRVVQHPAGATDLYLGLSDLHAVGLMDTMLGRLALIWLGAVGVAWLIAFASARRLLARVESLTTAAARIRSDDLSTRLPAGELADEIGYLARTLNGMLDRIAGTINQLRSLTDSVAHELKSPVTSIRGRLEIALSYREPERWRDAAILAIEDLDRLAAFVTTTLDVAEAEGGGLRRHTRPVDFSVLVRDLLGLYEPAFVDHRQTLRADVAPELVLWLDASLMQRVIANLLDNELRHGPAGTTVDVTLTATDDEVTLRVEDDGPGFPPELEARVFERFVKAGTAGGHGLGLAFARAIVVAHGGRVSAYNRAAGGAVVSVTLHRRHL